jgi:hypothetical protein
MTAAVYARGLGYTDEHFSVAVDRRLDEALPRWRAGEPSDLARRWAAMQGHDDLDELVTFESLPERWRTFERLDVRRHRWLDLSRSVTG